MELETPLLPVPQRQDGPSGSCDTGVFDAGLLQHAEVCAKIDVIRCAVDDEGWHGLHSGGFGLSDAILGGAKVDDLDIVAAAIECSSDVLLSSDADRAACVVEDGFGFHVDGCWVFGGWLTTRCIVRWVSVPSES